MVVARLRLFHGGDAGDDGYDVVSIAPSMSLSIPSPSASPRITSCRHANFNSFINSGGKRLAGSVGVEVAGSVN